MEGPHLRVMADAGGPDLGTPQGSSSTIIPTRWPTPRNAGIAPVRGPMQVSFSSTGISPRTGSVLVGIDFSGLEVSSPSLAWKVKVVVRRRAASSAPGRSPPSVYVSGTSTVTTN